jgi:O-methyltransferase domain/Dimerisation domain
MSAMGKNASPSAGMFTLITGRWVSHLIFAAARLELADHLKDGPRSVEELATAARVQAPALYRLLRALASVGVFAETNGKRFKLTPLAATLRKDVPGSMRAVALHHSLHYREQAWEQLLYGLTTGEVPFVKAHGISYFEYLEKHPDAFAIFNESMTSMSAGENRAIAAAYKFSRIGRLVDVGGGHGSLLAIILQGNPKLKGTLFDQPSARTRAEQDRQLMAKAVAGRCTIKAGDFFEAVPEGGDVYVIKRVLHDWDDERCVKILANCCAGMNEKGKVLVIESVIPRGNGPDRGKIVDMQMFIIGGHERTKEEFATLLRKAGLKLTRVVPTKCPLSIVEGVRA